MSAPGTCTLAIAAPPGSFPPRSVFAGSLIRFLISFTDIAGVLADPTTVTAYVGTSYADEVSLTPVKDSTGKYHADWDTSTAVDAIYYCDVSGTGAIVVETEIAITIKVPKL